MLRQRRHQQTQRTRQPSTTQNKTHLVNKHPTIHHNATTIVVINNSQLTTVQQVLEHLEMGYLHNFYVMGDSNQIDIDTLTSSNLSNPNNRLEMKEEFHLWLVILTTVVIAFIPLVGVELIIEYLGFIGLFILMGVIAIGAIGFVRYEAKKAKHQGKVIDKTLGYYWKGDLSVTKSHDIRQQEDVFKLSEIVLLQLSETDLDESIHYELNFVFADASRYNFLRFSSYQRAVVMLYHIATMLNLNVVMTDSLFNKMKRITPT